MHAVTSVLIALRKSGFYEKNCCFPDCFGLCCCCFCCCPCGCHNACQHSCICSGQGCCCQEKSDSCPKSCQGSSGKSRCQQIIPAGILRRPAFISNAGFLLLLQRFLEFCEVCPGTALRPVRRFPDGLFQASAANAQIDPAISGVTP